MTDYKLDAMIEVRKYLWEKMANANIFTESDYFSSNTNSVIIPIIPVQQQTELNQFLNGKKHLVYDKIGMSYEDLWIICCEQVLFTIYSVDVSEINEIRNFMTDLFRRMDESAKDVNRWSGVSDKFKFHSIHISDISAVSPSQELQGFLSADVVLEIKYSRHVDSEGRFL